MIKIKIWKKKLNFKKNPINCLKCVKISFKEIQKDALNLFLIAFDVYNNKRKKKLLKKNDKNYQTFK